MPLTLVDHELAADKFVTRHFTFDEMMEGHDASGRTAETKALKAVDIRS